MTLWEVAQKFPVDANFLQDGGQCPVYRRISLRLDLTGVTCCSSTNILAIMVLKYQLNTKQ